MGGLHFQQKTMKVWITEKIKNFYSQIMTERYFTTKSFNVKSNNVWSNVIDTDKIQPPNIRDSVFNVSKKW